MPSPFSSLFQSISKIFNRRRYQPDNQQIDIQPPFPFFKLPLLVQIRIVELLDFKDIVLFVLISPKFRKLISHINFKVNRIVRLGPFSLCERHEGLRVESLQFSDIFINFYWKKDKKDEFFAVDDNKSVKLNDDLLLKVIKDNEKTFVVIKNTNPVYCKAADYQFITDMLFEAFQAVEYAILTRDLPKEEALRLAHRYMNQTNQLYLSQNDHKEIRLTYDEMRSLLENYHQDAFHIRWNVEKSFSYPKVLKTKSMSFASGHWISLDNILSMECEDLKLEYSILTHQDLNCFVRKWLEGGFEKLKKLKVETRYSEEVDYRNDLIGIDRISVDQHTQQICRGDGKKAVVTSYRCRFIFTVDN